MMINGVMQHPDSGVYRGQWAEPIMDDIDHDPFDVMVMTDDPMTHPNHCDCFYCIPEEF